jgi:hypothetical protein
VGSFYTVERRFLCVTHGIRLPGWGQLANLLTDLSILAQRPSCARDWRTSGCYRQLTRALGPIRPVLFRFSRSLHFPGRLR